MSETVRPLTLSTPRSANDVCARLADLRRERPEWERWFALYEIVLDVAGDRAWEEAADATILRTQRAPDAPLLRGAVIAIPSRPADDLLRRLLATAELVHEPAAPEALFAGAINQEPAVDPAVETVAQLAVMPILRALNLRYGVSATSGWTRGYCPVCGAWPALIEQRGLERERRPRCGRCGCDWSALAHRCVLCGEDHHERLGTLLTDEMSGGSRIETCESCRGYVKVIAALRPSTLDELPLNDVATVELDLAALERGFRRPERPAVELDVAVSGGSAR